MFIILLYSPNLVVFTTAIFRHVGEKTEEENHSLYFLACITLS